MSSLSCEVLKSVSPGSLGDPVSTVKIALKGSDVTEIGHLTGLLHWVYGSKKPVGLTELLERMKKDGEKLKLHEGTFGAFLFKLTEHMANLTENCDKLEAKVTELQGDKIYDEERIEDLEEVLKSHGIEHPRETAKECTKCLEKGYGSGPDGDYYEKVDEDGNPMCRVCSATGSSMGTLRYRPSRS